MLSFPKLGKAELSKLGEHGLREVSQTAQNKHLGALPMQEKADSGFECRPSVGLLWEATLAFSRLGLS